MALEKDEALRRARTDLAVRLGVDEKEIQERSVEEADFPDMSLGSPVGGEMSAQMIMSGWRIRLRAKNQDYEYRADRRHLRLHNFKGKNYRV